MLLPEQLGQALRDHRQAHGTVARVAPIDRWSYTVGSLPVWFDVHLEGGPCVDLRDARVDEEIGQWIPDHPNARQSRIDIDHLVTVLIVCGWTCIPPDGPVEWGDFPRRPKPPDLTGPGVLRFPKKRR